MTVGETSGNVTEITKGLTEGDNVVLVVFTPGAGSGHNNRGTRSGEFPGGGQGFYGGGGTRRPGRHRHRRFTAGWRPDEWLS